MKKILIICILMVGITFAETRIIRPESSGDASLGTPTYKWGSVHSITGSFDQVEIAGTDLLDTIDLKQDAATTADVILNSTTNTFSINSVDKWRLVTLTNGVALEVYSESTTNWITQVEWTED